jgi:hypothetical protein
MCWLQPTDNGTGDHDRLLAIRVRVIADRLGIRALARGRTASGCTRHALPPSQRLDPRFGSRNIDRSFALISARGMLEQDAAERHYRTHARLHQHVLRQKPSAVGRLKASFITCPYFTAPATGRPTGTGPRPGPDHSPGLRLETRVAPAEQLTGSARRRACPGCYRAACDVTGREVRTGPVLTQAARHDCGHSPCGRARVSREAPRESCPAAAPSAFRLPSC